MSKLQAYADKQGITIEEARKRVMATRNAPKAKSNVYHDTSHDDIINKMEIQLGCCEFSYKHED